MIIVDTSVWISHLRRNEQALLDAIAADDVMMHPFVLGELACGNLGDRKTVLEGFHFIRPAPVADMVDVLAFIDARQLMGRGIGYVDMHLLVSAAQAQAALWTRDRRTGDAADELNLRYVEHS